MHGIIWLTRPRKCKRVMMAGCRFHRVRKSQTVSPAMDYLIDYFEQFSAAFEGKRGAEMLVLVNRTLQRGVMHLGMYVSRHVCICSIRDSLILFQRLGPI